MIGGATRGAGGRALGRHLTDTRHGQTAQPGASRGLVSATIRGQIAEIGDMAAHARTRTPLYHVHADPPPGAAWGEAQWARYWARFEREFDLETQPFAEAIHTKAGREHRHRVYSRVRTDGTAIRLDHDHPRREKINRLTEYDEGLPLVGGKHSRAVAAALEREGRADVVDAMRRAGLLDGPRSVAPTTPQERAQQQRTAVPVADVRAAAWEAYQSADPEAALAQHGLRLAAGDKGPVIVDQTGAAHAWSRAVGAGAKAVGARGPGARTAKTAVAALDMPLLKQARRAIRDRAGAAPNTVPPPQGRAHDRAAAPAAVVGRDRADDRGDQDRHDRDHQAPDSDRGRRRGPDRPDPHGPCETAGDDGRDPNRRRPPRLNRRGETAALTAGGARPGDAPLMHALTAATQGTLKDARREAPLSRTGRAVPLQPSRAGRRCAEAAAITGGPPRLGDAALADALAAARKRDAALATIRNQIAEVEQRVRRRAAALAAEAAASARLREAEDVRRHAGRAVDSHDERQPSGWWALVTGRSRRWREQRARLDATFDTAAHRELAAERDAAGARRAVAAVGRDGARDAERRDALRRVEAAVCAGRRDVMEAVAGGDLDSAVHLSRPPPHPVTSRAGQHGREPEPVPTVPVPVPAPRPPWTK